MRSKQKEYFITRRHTTLDESKALERQVYAEIERVNNIINNRPTEGDLFNQPT